MTIRATCDVCGAEGWREIDSAPKDSSVVLLYWPTMSITRYPEIGINHGDEYGWELTRDREYGEVFPTHWMPLPPTPEAYSRLMAERGGRK